MVTSHPRWFGVENPHVDDVGRFLSWIDIQTAANPNMTFSCCSLFVRIAAVDHLVIVVMVKQSEWYHICLLLIIALLLFVRRYWQLLAMSSYTDRQRGVPNPEHPYHFC